MLHVTTTQGRGSLRGPARDGDPGVTGSSEGDFTRERHGAASVPAGGRAIRSDNGYDYLSLEEKECLMFLEETIGTGAQVVFSSILPTRGMDSRRRRRIWQLNNWLRRWTWQQGFGFYDRGSLFDDQQLVGNDDPISSVLHGSRFLTGEVGGSLTHQCFYPITPANKYERKYWCKVAPGGACNTVVSSSGYVSVCRWRAGRCRRLVDTGGFVHGSYEGRVRVAGSDAEQGPFTVVLRDLSEDDAGWYWCGARSGLAEHTASVKLHVQRGARSSQGPETSAVTEPTSPAPAAYSTATQSGVTSQTCTEVASREGTSALVTTLRSATSETARREIHRGRE
ncbi:PREDICTED: high affinity immunoglobulin alpha and immunoglobulin mu Fc receptor [Tinamus guttatus]|uniref:high affinity immunoglobulin alpha and immunoglobulin mu Fc receptor n=1 Tax=Tinamus guttatus TaxID=94827 RepID=UPI00052E8BE0|nr:PREDICTED: high affinity immunoglobulin alpha and immunoglobulin mu Fc receptor [Tinamus guttatus]